MAIFFISCRWVIIVPFHFYNWKCWFIILFRIRQRTRHSGFKNRKIYNLRSSVKSDAVDFRTPFNNQWHFLYLSGNQDIKFITFFFIFQKFRQYFLAKTKTFDKKWPMAIQLNCFNLFRNIVEQSASECCGRIKMATRSIQYSWFISFAWHNMRSHY